jgi:DNA polymerase
MGWDGQGKLKKTDPQMYQLAKARVLALGYGAGWRKFILMALVMAGLDITKDDPEFVEVFDFKLNKKVKQPGYGATSKRIVKEFRNSNKLIVDLWNRLEGQFRASVGQHFDMRLPSGRIMQYRDVRCAIEMQVDPDTKKPFKRERWTANADGNRKYFYGGKLCENAVQAIARDVFGEHIAALDEKGVPCLFTVHDEGIFEVDKDFDVRDILKEMSRCPEWLKGCPISADVEEVERYKK